MKRCGIVWRHTEQSTLTDGLQRRRETKGAIRYCKQPWLLACSRAASDRISTTIEFHPERRFTAGHNVLLERTAPFIGKGQQMHAFLARVSAHPTPDIPLLGFSAQTTCNLDGEVAPGYDNICPLKVTRTYW